MTKESKGDELIEKFLKMEYGILQEYLPGSHERVATQCAIIAVEEIIKAWNAYSGMHDQDFFEAEVDYWGEVLNYLKSKL